jgi:hypothetical protein
VPRARRRSASRRQARGRTTSFRLSSAAVT